MMDNIYVKTDLAGTLSQIKKKVPSALMVLWPDYGLGPGYQE